ncbi:MAG: rod shape-determining protein RodA [Chitinivibrionales bacterium]|nr:rod shape-determining protein RodA [Chitinivibrionales bacterium]
MMQELQKKNRFDFAFFLAALGLWFIGVLLIYSATHVHTSGSLAGLARKQAVMVAVGLVIILAIVSIPPSIYYSLAYVFYGFGLLLLVYVIFSGIATKGAERWISVAGIKIQPSEFAKIGLLFALARQLATRRISLDKITSFLLPGVFIAVPFALVLQQPDLGTALVFCAMALPMFFWAGLTLVEVFYIVSPTISLILSAIPLILAFGTDSPAGIAGSIPWGVFFLFLCAFLYFARPRIVILVAVIVSNLFSATITNVLWNNFLKDYQKKRIISFINPQEDPFGAGYQVIQSKVAIGSGHLYGKGYLKGTQTRLSFLPEQHTDFIFSVLGEQFGLVGCIAILLLFLFLIVRGYTTTQSIRNRFINLVIVGAMSILAFHIFVNIAMTLGMMPVTGLPLPFLSYGGSFTITISILLGFVLNARVGRQDF